MYFPRKDNELDTLCNYLDAQLDAVRASAYGLDDAAARRTPLRSDLSVSGILKHVTFVMAQSLSRAGNEGYKDAAVDFPRALCRPRKKCWRFCWSASMWFVLTLCR